MVRRSVEEKVEIMLFIGEGVRSDREAAYVFDEPSIGPETVFEIFNLFRSTGHVTKDRKLVGHHIEVVVILASCRADPLQLNINHSKIWRRLKRHKMHAFEPRFLHILHPGDENRMSFV